MNTPVFQILLFVFFMFLTAPYCASYLLYRRIALGLAQNWFWKSPASLFVASIVFGYLWLFGTLALLWLGAYLLLENGHGGDGAAFLLGCFSIIAGPIGWIVLAILRSQRMREFKALMRLYPEPKFQIWLQDVLVGTFSLGLSMTLFLNLQSQIKDPAANATLAIYEILSQFVMFFAVMDVFRCSDRLKVPRDRAFYLLALMLVNALVPLPILTALSWNVWRRALFLAQVADPRK